MKLQLAIFSVLMALFIPLHYTLITSFLNTMQTASSSVFVLLALLPEIVLLMVNAAIGVVVWGAIIKAIPDCSGYNCNLDYADTQDSGSWGCQYCGSLNEEKSVKCFNCGAPKRGDS